jgi:hypothetical protein
MAALDEIRANGEFSLNGLPITQEIWDMFKPAMATFFWKWYHANVDKELFKVGFWFIHKTVHVSDLHGVFVLLFDNDPTPVAA